MKEKPQPLLFSVRETAGLLGVCSKTVSAMCKTGRLKSLRVGRLLRIRRQDVMELIDKAA